MTTPPKSCAAANPAIALRLQSTPAAGRVAELGTLGGTDDPGSKFCLAPLVREPLTQLS